MTKITTSHRAVTSTCEKLTHLQPVCKCQSAWFFVGIEEIAKDDVFRGKVWFQRDLRRLLRCIAAKCLGIKLQRKSSRLSVVHH
ncbi:hypothetical protein Enr13x_43540 [Stieleria neptunia]|uniref:Uncharacterized protein n=1 Tax=Stieleria neptunia TaxID=2527979 RepID=A0A518HUF5_9BACT|nr:hypothetical protein Enr13x_43540 [Stieleria neptunia]